MITIFVEVTDTAQNNSCMNYQISFFVSLHSYFRTNFAMCKYRNHIYAIGGYSNGVLDTVIRFDGNAWIPVCNLTVPRSALRATVLKGWPDPDLFFGADEHKTQK